MIRNPILIVLFLLIIESCILWISGVPRFKKYFKFIPPMFWIYFIPIIISTAGFLPQRSNLYPLITNYILPASLLLLLIPINLKTILKLEKPALIMMLTGSLGIMLSGPLVYFIFKQWLPPESWAGFGALSASWVGGSANMIAVKEAIQAPDDVFLPMIIVDTVVSYSWMGILIALEGLQGAYDKWNRSDTRVIEDMNSRIQNYDTHHPHQWSFHGALFVLTIAGLGTYVAVCLARTLPEVKNLISQNTWTIIIVSILGILLSLTRARRLEAHGVSKIGYFLLYFVLASIGARASLSQIGSAPLLILAGFIWVGIHAALLFVVSRIIKAPMFLIATASQANIGGPASAPIVAAVYQPALAPVGLLLAIIGNIFGTYSGILCAQLCRWVSQF